MDLDRGAGLDLDASQIPDELRQLIPLVVRWGFRSQSDQDCFVAEMCRRRPEDVAEFNRAMDRSSDAIRRWGMSLAEFDKQLAEFTDGDWAHPYWAFLAAKKVRELTGPSTDPESLESHGRMKEELLAEIRRDRFGEATREADDAFRRGEYGAYASILAPYEDLLAPTQRKKLGLAKKRR